MVKSKLVSRLIIFPRSRIGMGVLFRAILGKLNWVRFINDWRLEHKMSLEYKNCFGLPNALMDMRWTVVAIGGYGKCSLWLLRVDGLLFYCLLFGISGVWSLCKYILNHVNSRVHSNESTKCTRVCNCWERVAEIRKTSVVGGVIKTIAVQWNMCLGSGIRTGVLTRDQIGFMGSFISKFQ